MRRIIPFIALITLFQVVTAQEAPQQKAPEQKKEKEATAKEEKPKGKFNPSIGAGLGVTRFFGDVEDVNSTNIHRLGNRLAYDFTFKVNLSRSFNLDLNAIFGEVSGNENEHRQHRNFESKMFSMGLNLEYNFAGLYKSKKGKKPFLTPFLKAGIYYADYNPRTDLYTADGDLYYYWEDGFIRNMPEATSNPDEVELLERDYEYETHLTENPVTTIAFPVGGGFDLHLGEKVTFRLSTSYFFTMSDKLDNFNDGRYSNKKDGYYYNSIGVFWNFISERQQKIPGIDPDIYFYDFKSLDEDDTDNDGVPDLEDRCGSTPSAAKVDADGCPLDGDKDGIADYMDKEPNTKAGYIVDADGIAINFQKVAETAADTVSMKRSSVNDDFIFSQKSTSSQYTVHVATVSKNTSSAQKAKLNKLSGLVETQKDTITVYTLGNFSNFEDAEKKQNELISQGYEEAFAATPKAVEAIAFELEKREKTQKAKDKGQVRTVVATDLPADVDVVKFKVQLTEYRLRLQVDKLADMMAREGVELKTTTGGMKIYTIGSYDTFEAAQKIRKEILGYGVKEAEIVGSINNKTVSVDEAKQFLKKQNK
ncbi:MAG: hypothetical protein AB7G44_10980 [Bacteroidia bacterium]